MDAWKNVNLSQGGNLMKIAYFCINCRTVYYLEDESSNTMCGNCGGKLITTGYSEDDWIKLPGKEKNRIKDEMYEKSPVVIELKKKAEEDERRASEHEAEMKARASAYVAEMRKINDIYEYSVKYLQDGNNGFPSKDIEYTLNTMASNGWHLKSALTNEIGKNANSAGFNGISSGTNATIDCTVLIFERLVKKAE